MAHHPAERTREIRRRRQKRSKRARLLRHLAMAKDDETKKQALRKKLEELGAQIPA